MAEDKRNVNRPNFRNTPLSFFADYLVISRDRMMAVAEEKNCSYFTKSEMVRGNPSDTRLDQLRRELEIALKEQKSGA